MLQKKYNHIAISILLELSSPPPGATSFTLEGSQQTCTTTFLKSFIFENNVGVHKQYKVYYYCEISLEVDLTRLRERYRLLGRGRVLLLRPPAAAFHLPVCRVVRTGEGEGA